MYRRRLVPPDFAVPAEILGPGFRMRRLSLADAVPDFEAVMESAGRLRGFIEPGSDWPDGLTLHENRVDLGWHEREFTIGHSFAYTVMSLEATRCLGCAYVYPSDKAGFDAMAFWWVRTSEAALDRSVGEALRASLAGWPLPRIAFPGRDIPWPAWSALPDR